MQNKPTLSPETEIEFDEQFEFQLHEMVDGDWCPALAVPHYDPFGSTSTTKLKPNYSITQLKEKCRCGGDKKIQEIKQFIAKVEQRAIERERVRMNMIWEKIIIEKYPMSDSERNKIIIEYGLTPPTTNERKK